MTGNPARRGNQPRNREVGAGAQEEPATGMRSAENKTSEGWQLKIVWRCLKDRLEQPGEPEPGTGKENVYDAVF